MRFPLCNVSYSASVGAGQRQPSLVEVVVDDGAFPEEGIPDAGVHDARPVTSGPVVKDGARRHGRDRPRGFDGISRRPERVRSEKMIARTITRMAAQTPAEARSVTS